MVLASVTNLIHLLRGCQEVFQPLNSPIPTLLADRHHNLISLEVGASGVLLVGHPHARAGRRNRLRGLHIGKDDMTVKVVFVDILGRSIEVRTAAHHALPNMPLALLPDVDEVSVHASIKGNDSESRKIRKFVQFSKEQSEHIVTNATALVDRDSDVCDTIDLLASMDARKPLVDTSHGAGLIATLARLDEVSQHLTPINRRIQTLHNLLTNVSRDGTPIVTTVCLLSSLLHSLLKSLLGNFVGSIVHSAVLLAPTAMVVHRIGHFAATVTIALLAVLRLKLLIFLEHFKILLGGKTLGVLLKRLDSRDASHFGNVRKMGVNREVSRDVPHLRHTLTRKATRHMLVDNVPEFVLKHIGTLSKRKPKEKLGIVNHLKLASLLVDADASGRNRGAGGLVDETRHNTKKRLLAKKEIRFSINVIDFVSGFGFHASYLTSAPYTSRAG